MPNLRAKVYTLSIPFNLTFAHAEASRSVCDSYILEMEQDGVRGYGELIMRGYVNDPEGILDSKDKIISRLSHLIRDLNGEGDHLSLKDLKVFVLDPSWEKQDLPLLAAIEAAVLDILCRRENKDIYELLQCTPKREDLYYGGILPILSEKGQMKFLTTYKEMAISYIRIKLSSDKAYNNLVLNTARKVLGDDFDIRVDVNCAWDVDAALDHLEILNRWGVKLVEEPLGADHKSMLILSGKSQGKGVGYVADESAVSYEDVEYIIRDKTFEMLNLRIVKNGGLFRVLKLADQAENAGLKYQLGSHVGETGILSVMGRLAASLMENPAYVDGSFDSYILSENITEKSYTFGLEGKASVVRADHMGYKVLSKMLGKGEVVF